MKNIHVLPRDKPSRLQKNKYNNLFLSEEPKSYSDCTNQNIYITNHEEIKDGEFGLIGNDILSYHEMHKKWGMAQGKKIILTTDQDLIKDGVQAIDDEFLKWFVKNPSCEEVEVESNKCLVKRGQCSCSYQDIDCQCLGYKIIIPKEEPKQSIILDLIFYKDEEAQKDVEIDWSGFPKSTQEQVGYVEPKQETLEEVAERIMSNCYGYKNYKGFYDFGFKKGFDFSQQQNNNLYSEEEVKEKTLLAMINIIQEYSIINESSVVNFHEEWFEQFKKK